LEASAGGVAAALANWNGMRYVGRCLDSLQAQSVGVSPVVVVDNGSTDGSREWIQQHYDGVEVLENPTNLGVAAGYNRAISACACADASYILILNTDVFLEPDFIARALHALTASPDLGAVTGRLFQEGTGELISGGFFLRPQIRITYRELTDEACEVFGATGAAVLYRRDVLEDLKVDGQYFDDDYFAYGEDIDLAWRTQILGWKVRYEPSARAYHVGSGSLEGRLRFLDKPALYQRHTLKNRYLTVVKNASPGTALRLLPWLLVSELLLWPYLLVRMPRRVPFLLMGLVEVVRLLPAALRKRRQIQGRRRVPADHIRRYLRWF
jgi:GT2 family glycosyltransferase